MPKPPNKTTLSWINLLYLLPLLVLSWLNLNFQIDDALIYQRYILNLLSGDGLVYNPGERFNGLTSPLYALFSVLLAGLLQNVQLAAILGSTLCMGLALYFFQKAFAEHVNPGTLAIGAVFSVCMPYFYYVYGMETGLFLLFLALAIYFFEKQQIFYLGIVCALLILTRSEGVFLLPALAIEHFRQRRPWPKWQHFIIPALLFIAVYGFNKFYYGDFLAQTGMAKVYQGQSGAWGEWPIFIRASGFILDWFFFGQAWLLSSFFGLALLGVWRLGKRSLNVIVLSFLCFYSGFFIVLNIPGYHWYYAPYLLFLFLYAAIGIEQLINWINDTYLQAPKCQSLSLILILLFAPVLAWQTSSKGDFGRPNATYQLIGQWLEQNSPKDSRIALSEIGHVGYYSQRYIIDMLGLVNPLNAKLIGEKHFSQWLLHYQPDYILVHKPLWIVEQGAQTAVLMGDFNDPAPVEIPGFQLMHSQRLSVPVLPQIHSEIALEIHKEQGQYALLVHAPGEIRIALAPGDYEFSVEFGLPQSAYADESKTDGVAFSASLEWADQKISFFERELKPAQTPADQGFQQSAAHPFHLEAPATVVLRCKMGEQGNHVKDWALWRNLRLKQSESSSNSISNI